MKQRTTLAIDQNNYSWLKSKASRQGELSEVVDALASRERLLGPIEDRITKLIDRLAAVVAAAERN